VVVGGRPEQRGAVAAASYEARQYGIFSATPSRVAATKCKDLIFVAPHFEVYRQVSSQIRTIFDQFTALLTMSSHFYRSRFSLPRHRRFLLGVRLGLLINPKNK